MTPTGRGARSQDPDAVAARERLAEWSKGYSDAVVDGVIHYRDQRGLKNSDLLRRLSALGWDVTANTLAGILGKKRSSMPASDVMLFAAALNVPPIALLFGTYTDRPQRLAPTAVRDWKPYEAAKWFSGSLDLPTVDFADGFEDLAEDYYEVGDILSRAQEAQEAADGFAVVHAHLVVAIADGEDVTHLLVRAQEALDGLAEARRYLRLFHPEVALPEVRARLAFVDEPKPRWPRLPVLDFNTSDELAQIAEVRHRPQSELPAEIREQLGQAREDMLNRGIANGEA